MDNPHLGLTVKLCSIISHYEEFVGHGGNVLDIQAIGPLRNEDDVLELFEVLGKAGMLPKKRSDLPRKRKRKKAKKKRVKRYKRRM